ncbi:unnamed protein product [Protopolystoma xenopodis]|uniref:Uncharacterized protein n=1 Tax=Protopolystoma xenopodis TaxID=117903 RepID=A0A3S5CS12_9PLAT|nr:unnamed protein product [Protopolystoma xenopodis]
MPKAHSPSCPDAFNPVPDAMGVRRTSTLGSSPDSYSAALNALPDCPSVGRSPGALRAHRNTIYRPIRIEDLPLDSEDAEVVGIRRLAVKGSTVARRSESHCVDMSVENSISAELAVDQHFKKSLGPLLDMATPCSGLFPLVKQTSSLVYVPSATTFSNRPSFATLNGDGPSPRATRDLFPSEYEMWPYLLARISSAFSPF